MNRTQIAAAYSASAAGHTVVIPEEGDPFCHVHCPKPYDECMDLLRSFNGQPVAS